MAELDFEMALDRMFAEAPAFADADLFALKVDERLDRGWTFRRMLIGCLGLVGGLIGGAQLLGSGFIGQLDALSRQSSHLVNHSFNQLMPAESALGGMGVTGEALLMSGVLALAAVAFAVTRLIREI